MAQMKTYIKYSKTIGLVGMLLTTLMVTISCSKDGQDTLPPEAKSLEASLEEHPLTNAQIGKVVTNLEGDLVYVITSQTPEGAMKIDPKSGELSVSDSTLFDFELNPRLVANIVVSNTSETLNTSANVNLNDIDDIAAFLTVSRDRYLHTEDGQWVGVTDEEFKRIQEGLYKVSAVGLPLDVESYRRTRGTWLEPDYTWYNKNEYQIPTNHYIFGFKTKMLFDEKLGKSQVKITTAENTATFEDLGGPLPQQEEGKLLVDGNYILKGSSDISPNARVLAFYSKARIRLETRSKDGEAITTSGFRARGESNDLTGVQITNQAAMYRGLATPIKQWN